ncbi:uncharacterized protein LOC5515022 [Nematostella vectensis]|nr:uncharacterized protein LOC5515022 [Nematostella vectensis]
MAEPYSRLRRKRKRTHPAKCPCCRSDSELQQENGFAVCKEVHLDEAGGDSSKPKKRKGVKEAGHGNDHKEDKSNDNLKSRSPSPAPKKAPRRGSKRKRGVNNQQEKRTDELSHNNKEKKEYPKVSSSSYRKKPDNARKQFENVRGDKEFESDDEVALSTLKTLKNTKAVKPIKGQSKKGTIINDNSRRSKRASISRESAELNRNKDTSPVEKNDNEDSCEGEKPFAKKSKGKKKTVISKLGKAKNKPTETALNAEEIQEKLEKSAKPVNVSKLSPNIRMKIKVFDHLFANLKECINDKKLTMKLAASILLNVSAQDLNEVIPKEVNEKVFGKTEEELGQKDFDDPDQKEITGVVNRKKDKKTIVSDSEETISQAAEALVSFRSKSPILREDSKKIDNNESNKQQFLFPITSMAGQAPVSVVSTSFSPTQAVQALIQIHSSSQLGHQAFPTSAAETMPLPQQIFQSPGGYPVASLAGIAHSVPSHINQNQPITVQCTLPTFTQLANHLRQPLVTSGVKPLLNKSVVSPPLQATQMLFSSQSQAKTHSQAVNTLPPNQLQVLTSINPDSPALQAKLQPPQQPLKGMEEVIGNVGSNVPSLMWGTTPVVFLGSPQNLGGVPRNIIAAQSNPHDPGYQHHVALKPKAEGVATGSRGGQGGVPLMKSLGGRPILPRTQSRTLVTDMSAGASGVVLTSTVSMPSNVFHSTNTAVYSSIPQGAATPQGHSIMVVSPVASKAHARPQAESESGNTDRNSRAPGVSAKQAVKKLVHERTKSAELKREAPERKQKTMENAKTLEKIPSNFPSPKPKITPTKPGARPSEEVPRSRSSEFNIEQAATALLSIGAHEGSDGGVRESPSHEEAHPEAPDEKVVFTSKGMFRVGDVEVDPEYNRIGIEGYTCGKCGKIFTSLNYLARHIKRVCPDMSCRKWKCSMCDKAFRHPFGLQQHIYTHTGERPHQCPVCPKAFYSSNDLRRHSRIHSGERPYICKHCDKSFATTISLKTHTYIHTGEKPHKCPQCPKTFATSSKLGRHIVTHSEQRPFSCEQCMKSFNRSGDLRRHCMTVHEGKERAFVCKECSVKFTRAADLKRHCLTAHPTIPSQGKTLICSTCSAAFSTQICLKIHMDTHHSKPSEHTSQEQATPFKCLTCGKTYDSAVQLDKHQQAHEPASSGGYNSIQFQPIAPRPKEPEVK